MWRWSSLVIAVARLAHGVSASNDDVDFQRRLSAEIAAGCWADVGVGGVFTVWRERSVVSLDVHRGGAESGR